MSDSLEAASSTPESRLSETEMARVAAAMADSRAASTNRAYASKWRAWEKWCAQHGRQALPADSSQVASFMVELEQEGKALSTINGTAAAIRAKHDDAGLDDPTAVSGVRRVRAGLTRRLGEAPTRQAHPLTLLELRRMIATCDDGIRGVRDRAILLVGYAGALRRSELAGLDVPDVAHVRGEVVLTLRRSKSDQTKKGQYVGIPVGEHKETCPVTALDAWLNVLGADEGPVFCRITRHNTAPITIRGLSEESINEIVQSRAEQAGLGGRRISGHSLRAGHATSVSEAGVDAARIARTTRHARLETLAKYVRPAEVLRDTTARELGL